MNAASSIRSIIGPTILLGSGTYFDYENPEAAELMIEDVAYGLAFSSRFAGQCVSRRTGRRVYYPIAQHCVIMADHAPPGLKFAALMHEVGEATCLDMTAPLKSLCPDYKRVEKRCEAAGLRRFDASSPDPAALKLLDMRMLATERRGRLPWKGEEWTGTAEPFEAEIIPWQDPHFAADTFLATYHTLRS
ncbi:Putative hydrolase of HD superfamily [Neorhizobium galegae bv. officinalis]|nr:Putative hydrolase of HD superfamily [Neorhizobium galegae bv. officinalis]